MIFMYYFIQLPSQRDRCVYISNLPGNATLQKLESILEMDADCNVDETCMMKVVSLSGFPKKSSTDY